MNLSRCKDQSGSLEDFYSNLVETWSLGNDISSTMLSLIQALSANEDKRTAWGLTSHYKLCLLSQNRSDSDWYVRIIAADKKNYLIECLIPEELAPWPHAYAQGWATSEQEAVHMILSAMTYSKGWL
jgi:hypothetical protein